MEPRIFAGGVGRYAARGPVALSLSSPLSLRISQLPSSVDTYIIEYRWTIIIKKLSQGGNCNVTRYNKWWEPPGILSPVAGAL